MHVTHADPIDAVQEIGPVYPLNKEAPVIICWTPPPAYIMAPITHYHLRLTPSASGPSTGETTDVELAADRGVCTNTSDDAFRHVSNGGVYALSLAAESKLGKTAYTSTTVILSLHKG